MNRLVSHLATVAAVAAVAALALTSPAAGATCPGQCQSIASNPLTVKVSADTAIQVYYAGDVNGQVFSPRSDHGNSGTYVAAAGRLFGPGAPPPTRRCPRAASRATARPGRRSGW